MATLRHIYSFNDDIMTTVPNIVIPYNKEATVFALHIICCKMFPVPKWCKLYLKLKEIIHHFSCFDILILQQQRNTVKAEICKFPRKGSFSLNMRTDKWQHFAQDDNKQLRYIQIIFYNNYNYYNETTLKMKKKVKSDYFVKKL